MTRISRMIVAFCLAIALLDFTGCTKKPVIPGQPPTDPKAELLSNIDDVLFSLNEAKPIICSLVPVACAGVTTGLSIAQKVRDAIVENNDPGAVALFIQLIPVISVIVDKDINGLSAANKTLVLSLLAGVNIGMHFLSKRLAPADALVATRDRNASVLAQFNAEPVWGLQYKTAKKK